MLTHSVPEACFLLKARGGSLEWSLMTESQLDTGQPGLTSPVLAEKHQTKALLLLYLPKNSLINASVADTAVD